MAVDRGWRTMGVNGVFPDVNAQHVELAVIVLVPIPEPDRKQIVPIDYRKAASLTSQHATRPRFACPALGWNRPFDPQTVSPARVRKTTPPIAFCIGHGDVETDIHYKVMGDNRLPINVDFGNRRPRAISGNVIE